MLTHTVFRKHFCSDCPQGKHWAPCAEWATRPWNITNLKERLTDQTRVDLEWKTNEMSLSLQGKQLPRFVANHQIWTSKQKLEVWKTCIHHCGFKSFSTFKTLLMRPVVTITNISFLFERCQHLEDLPNSVNHYFPNDHCVLEGSHLMPSSPSDSAVPFPCGCDPWSLWVSAPRTPFLTARPENSYNAVHSKGRADTVMSEEITPLMNLKHNAEQNKSDKMTHTALIFLQSSKHQESHMTVFRDGGVGLSHEGRRTRTSKHQECELWGEGRTGRGWAQGNAELVTRGSRNKPKRTSKPNQWQGSISLLRSRLSNKATSSLCLTRPPNTHATPRGWKEDVKGEGRCPHALQSANQQPLGARGHHRMILVQKRNNAPRFNFFNLYSPSTALKHVKQKLEIFTSKKGQMIQV